AGSFGSIGVYQSSLNFKVLVENRFRFWIVEFGLRFGYFVCFGFLVCVINSYHFGTVFAFIFFTGRNRNNNYSGKKKEWIFHFEIIFEVQRYQKFNGICISENKKRAIKLAETRVE